MILHSSVKSNVIKERLYTMYVMYCMRTYICLSVCCRCVSPAGTLWQTNIGRH